LRVSTFISWAAETSILGYHGFAIKIVFSLLDLAIHEDTVAAPDACFSVDSSKTSESRERRTVRSQKKIHDADKAELLTLEETYSAVLAPYKRTQIAVKWPSSKLKSIYTVLTGRRRQI
jgi:hypothetical protein